MIIKVITPVKYYFIFLLLSMLMASCRSLPKEHSANVSHFFPQGASYYVAFNPQKIHLKDLPLILEKEQHKALTQLLKRSSRVMLFQKDIGYTGYFKGNYPKKIIDSNLRRNSNFINQVQGFRDKASNLEFFLPNSKELYISQNSLSSVLNQNNPSLEQLFSPLVAQAFTNDDFVIAFTNPSKILAPYISHLNLLPPIQLLRLSLNKQHSLYHSTIELQCANALSARALSAVLRTIRPMLVKQLEAYQSMDVSTQGSSLFITGQITVQSIEAFMSSK